MKIQIPEYALITLIGISGSGKSTFAQKHFQSNQIFSENFCKKLISQNETEETTEAAQELLNFITKKRLALGHWTVIDDNNLSKETRKKLIQTARNKHVVPVAIVFDLPKKWSPKNMIGKIDSEILKTQYQHFKNDLPNLKKEGFKKIIYLNSPEDLENCQIIPQKMRTDKKHISGPFDIIGDVHGCVKELMELLGRLGYKVEFPPNPLKAGLRSNYKITPPPNRTALFVGDLVDRGPASNKVLRLVMSMVKNKQAYCIVGNHDDKLMRKLDGRDVNVAHGLAETLDQLESEPPEFVEAAHDFLKKLQTHYIFDEGKLLIAHAGLTKKLHNRVSKTVRSFCMYGETTGKVDARGVPIRINWAKKYRGNPMIVYGHTPVPEVIGFNNTFNIDTGCVFGGKLTALRYPELEIVEVPAKEKYAEPSRPLGENQFKEMQRF